MRSNRRGRWNSFRCGCRCRRSTSSMIAASSPSASNQVTSTPATRSSSCPPARLRRSRRSRATAGATPLASSQTAGRSVGITLDPRTVHRARRRYRPFRTKRADTRRIRAPDLVARQANLEGEQITIRLGTRETVRPWWRSRKAIDRALSSEETQAIARNHVGEIDISLAQPVAADPYTGKSAHWTPRDRSQRPDRRWQPHTGGRCRSARCPVDIVPVESALRTEERSARYRHSGAVIWLADYWAPENPRWPARWSADCSPAAVRRSAGWRHPARRAEQRSRFLAARIAARTHPPAGEVATHLAHNGHVAIVAAVSPSAEDRAAARRIADTTFREIHVATPAEGVREPRSQRPAKGCARPAVVHRDHQRSPAAGKVQTTIDAASCWHKRNRANAGADRHPVRRTGRSRRQYLGRRAACDNRGSPRDATHSRNFRAKRAGNTRLWSVFGCFSSESS